MIRIGTRDDRAEHDWFVGLVLEIFIVQGAEFRSHFFDFGFGRTDLEASVDGVGRETGFFRGNFPFLEELGIATFVSGVGE